MGRTRSSTVRQAEVVEPIKTAESSPLSSRSPSPVQAQAPSVQTPPISVDVPSRSDDNSCPACTPASDTVDKENWIRCDACKEWYHWGCAGDGTDVNTMDKWFCKACLAQDSSRVITLKAPTRKSSRKRPQRDYANMNAGLESDPNRYLKMMDGKSIQDAAFRRMEGNQLNHEWLENDPEAMLEPIVIENPSGLGMKMPSSDFSVDDVARLVGLDTPVEVIDVATQSTAPGWTLRRWAEYFNTEPSAREKICNVISLEVSGTKLSDLVLPPTIVRELDWVENFWPNTRKGKGQSYPKVQLYCLMGVASAWTDWHVDFAGSSVYYHILRGSKIFYFIRPTPANLAAYERWSGTELQSSTWLGDMVDEVLKVVLEEGYTMIIPSGWIHAVYTPVDTLVFGGNFLHSYSVPTQLKVRNIEIATLVPKKFRFPLFNKLCWYVGEKYLRDLKLASNPGFHGRVLLSISALADFLVSEARLLERGNDQQKKETKEHIPADRIKDAPALARELRWRARSAAGYNSDDESPGPSWEGLDRHRLHKKRKLDQEPSDSGTSHFKNFTPVVWDGVVESAEEDERESRTGKPKEGEDLKERWLDWNDSQDNADEEAHVKRRRRVISRVRRSEGGLERHRIEHVVEQWRWESGVTAVGNDVEMKSPSL